MVSVLSVSGENDLVSQDDFIGRVTTVEIDQLLPTDLTRLDGISEEHVALIADSELCIPHHRAQGHDARYRRYAPAEGGQHQGGQEHPG